MHVLIIGTSFPLSLNRPPQGGIAEFSKEITFFSEFKSLFLSCAGMIFCVSIDSSLGCFTSISFSFLVSLLDLIFFWE